MAVSVQHDQTRPTSGDDASSLDSTIRERVADLEAANVTLAAERLSAEARLALSEATLQLAIDAAEIGTWDLDLVSNVLTWPPRTKAMFGLSPDAPCSLADFYAGLHPDDLAATSTAFEAALDPAIRSTYDVEYRTIGKEDGVVRWVAAKGKGVFNDAGVCVRAIGTAIDITARKATEERLRASETQYRTLFETIDEGFCVVEFIDGPHGPASDYLHLEANPAYVRHSGISNIVGRTGREALTEGEAEGWVDIFHKVLKTGEPIRFERELEATGRWLDVACFVADAGRNRLAILFTDITPRKEAERRLRELNETLEQRVADATAALLLHQNIVQSNPGPILAFDRDLRVTAFNQPHADKFFESQGAPSYIGQRFPDFFIPEDRTQITALMERALAGEAFTTRVEFGDPAHSRLHWDLTHGPLRDADGAIIGGFHHAVEVTAQVMAERELAESREALRQAQKMEAVGQLTGGLAHDFNNLLTGIMGNLELLQTRLARGRLDDLERFIVAAQSAGQRAAALTQRLLAFSRRQTLDPKPTDVNGLIAGMEDLLRRTVGPENTLEIVGAQDLWTANIDAGQLENALLNLCINARDAMPDGGRLTIKTENDVFDQPRAKLHDLPPGEYLTISVSDSGAGMDAQTVERAFEPFFTTKPIGQGTGLGLSMIYGFARQSGGQAHIQSAPGRGTTVCIHLPRHRGSVALDLESRPAAFSGETRGGTVLIIDDEATIRDFVEDVLNDRGYRVISAPDGASGVNLLQSAGPIDLLVTDVGLPNGMNGRQVADAARALQPGLKVLFITGYAESAALGDGSLEPGMALLTKPFAIDALLKKMSDMLTPPPH